jgi:hypothetical protein
MKIEFSDDFERWFGSLTDKPKKRIVKIVDMLEMMGQGLLGTKYAKSIVNSADLFELVIQVSGQPYRVLYGIIAEDGAVLLIGGNKKGDDRFYDREVPRAEAMLARWRDGDGE